MTRYIAFLRAVNVGGRIVKMADLRKAFESMGYTGVQTFIASGNVVFESSVRKGPALEKQIEALLQDRLGMAVPAFVRTASELAAVAAHQPFPAEQLDANTRLFVAFIRDEPSRDAQRTLLSRANALNEYRVRGREVYWLVRGSFFEATRIAANLEKVLAMPATVRNSTTVRKMADKFCR